MAFNLMDDNSSVAIAFSLNLAIAQFVAVEFRFKMVDGQRFDEA